MKRPAEKLAAPASLRNEAKSQFGRYDLLGRLGIGGMAEVFVAREIGARGFTREVAIKRILPEFANQHEFIDMLVAEARVCAMLQHPVIVQIFDFGEINGIWYLALELVEGFNLRQVLQSRRKGEHGIPPGLACHIVAQVASALAFAHGRTDTEGRPMHIVHRDVSLSNIMLSKAGTVKLLDFGIAKAANFIRDEQTRTGMLKGKVSYMSPEQAAMGRIDKRSDIFSLGVVLHELLVGKRLFRGETDVQSLALVQRAIVPPPSSLVPGLSVELDAIVAKMLAVSVEQRYQDCHEVVALLEPLAHRLGNGSTELHRYVADMEPQRVEATVTGSDSGHATGESEMAVTVLQKSASHSTTMVGRADSRWISWAIALAVLVVAGLILAYGLRRPGNAPPALTLPHPTGSAPSAEPPRAAMVRLKIIGTTNAEVSLDGASVGTVPVDLNLPRASGTRLLEVSRPGYLRYAHRIAAGFDVTLRIELTPTMRSSDEPPFHAGDGRARGHSP